jgi:hypothetical protein
MIRSLQKTNKMLIFLTFVLAVAAQNTAIGMDQYTALRLLLTGLNCTPPRCPDFELTAPCPNFSGDDKLLCENSNVVRIEFQGGGLSGSINGAALRALTFLTHLRLFGGALLSSIPTEVGLLTALTVVDLRVLGLTGTVPSQVGSLRNLGALVLANNGLTGTLPALDKLTKLTLLRTSANVGLGGNMTAMPLSLRELFINNCSFTALPPNLGALTALTKLQANKNDLAGRAPVLEFATDCILQDGFAAETNCFDCPASGTVSSCKCAQNAGCAVGATTVTSATVAKTLTTSSTTKRPTTTASTMFTTARLSPATASASNGGLEPWVIGVLIGGAVLALVLVALGFICNHKHRQRAQRAAELAKEPHSENGGELVAPPATSPHFYGDITDVRAPASK